TSGNLWLEDSVAHLALTPTMCPVFYFWNLLLEQPRFLCNFEDKMAICCQEVRLVPMPQLVTGVYSKNTAWVHTETSRHRTCER
uniref:Uncharacterized protein n=1 Tax=Anabas testudineus TaxID=64144 RepID=A0A3Q1I5N6_ANATE